MGLVCATVGCERSTEIGRYQVPAESAPTAASRPAETSTADGSPQRMLAAIVPADAQVWFLKAMGPVDQVAKVHGEFQQLLSSLDFASPDRPTWKLPAGWTEQPGNQFRYATLLAGDLEITVSSLPAPGGNASPQYILDNVNRWRDQLQLTPVTVDQLEQTTQKVNVAGRPAYVVDLTGVASANAGMMRGPFQAAGGAPAAAPSATAPSAPAGSGGAGGLQFEKPENWQEGRTSSFRLASFQIEQDGRTAEVTVIALGPASGSVLDNVNRWREQINLPPIDQARLTALIENLEVDGTPSQYVRLIDTESGGRQAILAVIVPRPDQTVYIKMMGPSDLVQAEQGAFEQFVGSIRFAPQ
jgi:hypothetical protein